MILSFLRTALLYLVLVLAVRLMGKRQIGQMEASEFVVTMLVANLAAIPMQDGAIALYSGLVPILTVLGLELVLAGLLMRSVLLRRIFCGKPVILIDNGKILSRNLRRTRVTLDELMGHLRQKGALEITDVQFAILETDGTLSVFLCPEKEPATAEDAGVTVKKRHLPISIIQDGQICRENLQKAGKDQAWLEKTLKQYGTREDTLLLTVDDEGTVVWLGREEE